MVEKSAIFLQHSNTPSLQHSTADKLIKLRWPSAYLIIGYISVNFSVPERMTTIRSIAGSLTGWLIQFVVSESSGYLTFPSKRTGSLKYLSGSCASASNRYL